MTELESVAQQMVSPTADDDAVVEQMYASMHAHDPEMFPMT